MRIRSLVISLVAMIATAGSVAAADPNAILGKWLQSFPNGNGMVTEFTSSMMSYYPIDKSGKVLQSPQSQTVTYKDLGGSAVAVNFVGGRGIMVLKNDDGSLTMDFPGLAAFKLTKFAP